MSARSKEKVGNALRKIFKVGSDKVASSAAATNVVAMADEKMAATNGNSNINNNNCNNMNQSNDNKKRVAANNNNMLDIAAKSTLKEKYALTELNNNNFTSAASSSAPNVNIRSRRLMKEFRELKNCQRKDKIFSVELVDDNLYEWHARLHTIDPDSKLAHDMAELNIPNILLHLVFPENFPFAPPFMRVVEPRIEKGYVMEGGAICMELLTPRGWASAYTIEAVLVQFAASVVKGQGRVMRKSKGNKEFSRRAAEESFRSLVRTHDKYGWVTPSLSDG